MSEPTGKSVGGHLDRRHRLPTTGLPWYGWSSSAYPVASVVGMVVVSLSVVAGQADEAPLWPGLFGAIPAAGVLAAPAVLGAALAPRAGVPAGPAGVGAPATTLATS